MKNTPRHEAQQRVDLEDYTYAVADAPVAFATTAPANFYTDRNATQRQWVIDGFTLSGLTTSNITVTRGVGILSFRDGNSIKHGALTVEGDATRTQSLVSGFADATTYSIFIRFDFLDGEEANRIFWNAGSTSEYAQEIATRNVANWTLFVGENSPGSEYLKIGELSLTGGLITTLTDMRPLYFEGVVSDTYARQWGSGNDRDNDRQQHGVKDLRTALDALYKKVEELQSGTNPSATNKRWWEAPTNSLDDMLPLSGATGVNDMRGDIHVSADATHSLGEVATRWLNTYSINVEASAYNAQSTAATIGTSGTYFDGIFTKNVSVREAVTNLGVDKVGDSTNARTIGSLVGNFRSVGATRETTLWEKLSNSGNNLEMHTYMDDLGSFIRGINAESSGDLDTWTYGTFSTAKTMMRHSTGGFLLRYAASGAASPITWTDVLDVDFPTQTLTIEEVDAPTKVSTAILDMAATPLSAVTGPNQLVAGLIPKAWAVIDVVSGVGSVLNGVNIGSVSSVTAATVVLSIDEDLADTNYSVVVTDLGSSGVFPVWRVLSQAVGSVTLGAWDVSVAFASGAINPTSTDVTFAVAIFGDQ